MSLQIALPHLSAAGDPPPSILPQRLPDLSFEVYAEPIPQGSMRAIGEGKKTRLISDNPRTKPWRERVAYSARAAQGRGWTPMSGAVVLALEFYMPRPKVRPKTRRCLPITKPDLDKLTRGVCDALTAAGTYEDDARVVDAVTRVRYAAPDARLALPWEPTIPAARIGVWEMPEEDSWLDAPLIPVELVSGTLRTSSRGKAATTRVDTRAIAGA